MSSLQGDGGAINSSGQNFANYSSGGGPYNSSIQSINHQYNQKSREVYVKSALDNYNTSGKNYNKGSTRVAFTDQKNSHQTGGYLGNLHNKTTDDLLGLGSVHDFSRSIGPSANLPTHFTSNLSNMQNVNSLEVSQINLPQINNSRMSRHTNNTNINQDLHNNLKYGPFQKHFIMSNKKAITRLIKQAMLKEDNEPFKGYTEVSNATVHLKKHQQSHNNHGGNGKPGSERDRSLMQNYSTNMNNSMIEPSLESTMIEVNEGRSGSANPGTRNHINNSKLDTSLKTAATGLNSKVMETWINETLADAEHLDIPGVILKPEHKNPISRYAIDRLTLTNAGIPNETVDRVYRSLFVYSVGFYELIKKLVVHCQRKYSIITSIWKVFSVLLEYCCQSDYRMLISEITNQHEEEIEKMDKDFQQKCQEFLNNEKILKQNMEVMQKYSEELEKERTNERTLRLKLEEEYMQNSKNHEEEVQLRLKFESKLNSMHSMHRELEIRYKRLQIDYANAQQLIIKHEKLIEEQSTDIIHLKVIKTENESKINLLEERKAAMEREINLKNSLVEEMERRMRETQDESDMNKYQLHEQSKEMTEQRLKIDCLDTRIEGLISEKSHLEIALKETQEFKKVFENKNEELMDKYNQLLEEHNNLRQKQVGAEETIRSQEEKVLQQREKIVELIVQCQDFERQNGTMRVELEKIGEVYRSTKNDLDDAVERLHLVNRARHELELRLTSEQESNASLQQTLNEKMVVIVSQENQIDTLENKLIDSELKCEQLGTQISNNERLYEMKIQTLNDKLEQLKQIIENERDLRDEWVEKFEREQRDNNEHSAAAMIANSRMKDLELELSNMTIKYENQCKLSDQLQEQLTQTTQQFNEKLVTIDNQRREMHGLKETHTQIAGQKKEYIKKMLSEIDTMKDNMQMEINQESQAKEEYYSRLAWLYRDNQFLKLDIKNLHEQLTHKQLIINSRDTEIEQVSMVGEDKLAQLIKQIEKYDKFHEETEEYKMQMTQLLKIKEQVRVELTQKVADLEKERQELQETIAGMKVQFDARTEVFKNKINELVDVQTKLQSDQQQMKDIHDRELRDKMKALEEMELEKEKMLSSQAPRKQKPQKEQQQTQSQMVVEQVVKQADEQQTITEKQEQVEKVHYVEVKSASVEGQSDRTLEIQPSQEVMRKVVETRDQETQTFMRVKKVRGDDNMIEDSVELDRYDIPGNKLMQQVNKRRDSMTRKLKEQLEHINNYPSYNQEANLANTGGAGSKTRSQVNLIRMSNDGNQSQSSNLDSKVNLSLASLAVSVVGQPHQLQPEKPSAWQKLAKNVQSDPYKQMLKSISTNSKGGGQKGKLKDSNDKTASNDLNQSKNIRKDSKESQDRPLQNDDSRMANDQREDKRRASLEKNQINMESHQSISQNQIMQDDYPNKSKTQMASEKDLMMLNQNSAELLYNKNNQQPGSALLNEKNGSQIQQNKNDQSHISLETAQKYHYMNQQTNSTQDKPLNQLQQQQHQQNAFNSIQTLQPFSTIGSIKNLPQPLTDLGVEITTDGHNQNENAQDSNTNNNRNNVNSGGMPSAYLNNPQLIQQQQELNHLQQQALQPGSNREQINAQLKQLQSQQQQLMNQYKAQQLQLQVQQRQQQQQSNQAYKKPDGGPSIKGLIRGAATRQ